jgi:RNA polymerase sigma factor (sigma-70 family)
MLGDDGSAERASSEFEAAYRDYFGSVWRYAALSTRNRADADELAQEVFERAFRAVSNGRGPKPGLWEPWLLLTTRRLLISHHRRHRLLKWLPLEGDNWTDAAHSACFDEAESNLWLDQITRLLPARQREALFLRYLGDLDDAAVGAVLGIGPSAVRSLVSRAMAHLREHEELWQ